MSRKKDKPKGRGVSTSLSAPSRARRLVALLTDEGQDGRARLGLLEWVDQLTNEHGCGSGWSPENFDLLLPAFRRAAAATERMKPKAEGFSAAVQAYAVILEALDRTAEGSTLGEVFAEREARREEALRKSLRGRAEAIVNDPRGYDADTRRAVSLSLEKDDDETLAEIVRRAEAGDTVCDLTDPELQDRCDPEDLSVLLAAVMRRPDLPRYAYDQIAEALGELFNRLDGRRQRRITDSQAYLAALFREHADLRREKGGGV
jgi:nucleotide-binding universal stress UspA family protein